MNTKIVADNIDAVIKHCWIDEISNSYVVANYISGEHYAGNYFFDWGKWPDFWKTKAQSKELEFRILEHLIYDKNMHLAKHEEGVWPMHETYIMQNPTCEQMLKVVAAYKGSGIPIFRINELEFKIKTLIK